MKNKILLHVFFLLCFTLAFVVYMRGANVTIKDIATTSVLPAADDYTVTDGATYGTRKTAVKGLTYLTATRTSLAALSITGASDGTGILVLGASAAGDGGGSAYFWSASSTATPNGNTVIQPASLPGTGRWLKAVGGVTFPGPSTLGGVFSNAGGSHLWISAINTDGTVTLAQPGIGDITGLGSMAGQNSNAVSILGGAIGGVTVDNSVIGGTTPANGTFLTMTATGATVTKSAIGATNLNLGNTSSGGHSFQFYAAGQGTATPGQLGIGDSTSSVTLLTVDPTTHRFTMTGIDGTPLGTSTPSTGVFTTISINSLANLRTTKVNLNFVANVKDYGALGDGSTNDSTAIASAISAAISAHGTVYFPPGVYKTNTISVSGASGLAIIGDGMGVSVLKEISPNQVLNISSSNHVTVSGLTFDGSCTTRSAGKQAVFFDCSQSAFQFNEIINSGEYAFFAGSSGSITDIRVVGNYIRACYADGINLQNVQKFVVSHNTVDGADDDLIALGFNGSGPCANGVVVGNYLAARTDLGTTWGRGIWIGAGAHDLLVEGNGIFAVKQTGIYINGAAGAACFHITVRGNYVTNAAINSGHGIVASTVQFSVLEGNVVENPASGNCIDVADWNHLVIKGGLLRQTLSVFCRGIHADEGTGWSSSTWSSLLIKDVDIQMTGSGTNSCVYLVPNASYTMADGGVISVAEEQNTSGDYITVSTARASGSWKVGNNIAITPGRTVNPSSTTGAVTVFNNN